MAHIKSEVNSIEMNRNVQQTALKVSGTLADRTGQRKRTHTRKRNDEREGSMRTSLQWKKVTNIAATEEEWKREKERIKIQREKMLKTKINNQALMHEI